MESGLKEAVRERLKNTVNALGFASVDRFADAPEKHHPATLCRGAETVIVFGITVPRGVLTSPDYGLHALHRTYHTIYRRLDDMAVDLCNFIETRSGCRAVPVPSYAPMVFHGLEPWGLLSLKHAAVKAGVGSFGRSEQVYHPTFGALLRLAAVVTNAAMPGDPLIEADPCPPKCNACLKVCPAKAFGDGGRFGKMICLGHAIKHAIYPLALKDETGLKNIERIINTAGHDYWIACNECVKACPNNR
jgi:epoxyqueuosine reductase